MHFDSSEVLVATTIIACVAIVSFTACFIAYITH